MRTPHTTRQRRPKDQKRIPLSMRITPETRDRLVAEAADNGRSITQEAELRLQQSFRDDRSLDQALDFKFGGDMMAALLLIEGAFRQAEVECAWAKDLAGQPGGANWATDPYVFDQTLRAMGRALETLRPPGDSAGPQKDEAGDDLSSLSASAGVRAASTMLDAIIDPPNSRFGRWAAPIAERLGPELVERIRAAEREPGKTIADRIERSRR